MKMRSLFCFIIALSMCICAFVSCSDEKKTDTSVTSNDNTSDDGTVLDTDLIYYENFDGRNLHKSNKTVFDALGWHEESLLTGAPSNNTSSYKITDYNGNRCLYIVNNESGCGDSYVTVLSSALMGKYHEENYTYQYDVVYESAANAERYVAMVSDYGNGFYNTFHLRNGGTANNQCCDNGTWYTYDSAPASKDDGSILKKLIGVDYKEDAQALNGISISVRYVVDWAQGNSVYLRVNTEGYESSGVWILVSKLSNDDAKGIFKPEVGGGALVLKTGGKQNAYVDNIVVWRGTADEPENKTAMLVDAQSSACTGHLLKGSGENCLDNRYCVYCGKIVESTPHNYEEVAGDKRCKLCGVIESNIASETWFLDSVPAYDGGICSSKAYECGQGLESGFSYENESLMMIVRDTNRDEFEAYIKKLTEDYGYDEAYELRRDGNLYYQLSRDNSLVYAYYTYENSEARIIDDKNSDTTVNEFGYVYEKAEDDKTVLYQIGLPMNSRGEDISNSAEKKINCGMMYAIKLADNSVLIIDGGGTQQFDDDQCDFIMSFLREITGTPEGEEVRIAAWYITHGHADHMAGFCRFSEKYNQQIKLERLMFNFPSVYSNDTTQADAAGNYNKFKGYIEECYGDDGVKFAKLHTGQSYDIADVSINVIYTHEDIVDSKTAETEVSEDYNNGSLVSYFLIDGQKFMLTGDINRGAARVLMEYNSADTLKSDVIQCAHHCLNYIYEMYDLTQAPMVLMPQSPTGCIVNSSRKAILDSLKKYASDEDIYYASLGTYGFEVVGGKFEQVYFAECVGGEYTGWGW